MCPNRKRLRRGSNLICAHVIPNPLFCRVFGMVTGPVRSCPQTPLLTVIHVSLLSRKSEKTLNGWPPGCWRKFLAESSTPSTALFRPVCSGHK